MVEANFEIDILKRSRLIILLHIIHSQNIEKLLDITYEKMTDKFYEHFTFLYFMILCRVGALQQQQNRQQQQVNLIGPANQPFDLFELFESVKPIKEF